MTYFENWTELVGGDCGFQPVGLRVFVPPEYGHYLEADVALQREQGVDTQLIGSGTTSSTMASMR